MGRKPVQYKKGQVLGPHKLVFIEELPSVLLPSGVRERKIKVYCPMCGKDFVTDLRRVVKKSSTVRQCPSCMSQENNKRIGALGKKSIVDLTGQRFGRLTVLEVTDKRQNRNPVWKCRCDCGAIKEINGVDLKRGHSQSCGCLRSRGEERISKVLSEMNISFVSQKTFDDCLNFEQTSFLYFDFYLPDHNCCIEYDGEQHFHPVEHFGGKEKFLRLQQHDKIKNEYCKNNNIKMIRISYVDYNKINKEYLSQLI